MALWLSRRDKEIRGNAIHCIPETTKSHRMSEFITHTELNYIYVLVNQTIKTAEIRKGRSNYWQHFVQIFSTKSFLTHCRTKICYLTIWCFCTSTNVMDSGQDNCCLSEIMSLLLLLDLHQHRHYFGTSGKPRYIFNLVDITKLPCYPYRRSTRNLHP